MINARSKVLTAQDIMDLETEIAKQKADRLEKQKARMEAKKAEEEAGIERMSYKERQAKQSAEYKAREREREAKKRAEEAEKTAEAEAQKREEAFSVMAGVPKKKRKSNSPFVMENNTATRDEMASTVKNKMKWFVLGKELGKPQNDEEVFQRITQFWDMVRESGEVPQKTDLFMFLGISEVTYLAWKNGQGCSRERMETIQMVEYLFMSVVDNTALKGDIQQIPYIWQTKQWFGYKEPKAELEVTNHNPMQSFPDAMAVEQKYQDLITGDTEVDPKYLANVEVDDNDEQGM